MTILLTLLAIAYIIRVITNPVKVIKSKEGVTHFIRYSLLDIGVFRIYIHKILQPDKDLHLHSHPWNFISIVLYGAYLEQLEGKTNIRNLLKINYYTKNDFHKIKELYTDSVLTLNFCWGIHTDWYYKVDNDLINFKEYRYIKNYPNNEAVKNKAHLHILKRFKNDKISEKQIEKAYNWYLNHKEHVDSLIKDLDWKKAYAPTDSEDKNNPNLWKPNHWKWFFN